MYSNLEGQAGTQHLPCTHSSRFPVSPAWVGTVVTTAHVTFTHVDPELRWQESKQQFTASFIPVHIHRAGSDLSVSEQWPARFARHIAKSL